MPQARSHTRRDAIETRAALLKAAGDVFARHGFRDANLRTICSNARVNLGAVSHYFGSKQALYNEVLVVAHQQLVEREPPPPPDPDADPSQQLRQWIGYVLRFVLVRRANHPHAGPLFARELRDPTPGLDELLKTVLVPLRRRLHEVVGRLLPSSAGDELRQQCTTYVMGLCVFQELGSHILHRIGHPVPRTADGIEALADQLTRFALGGIAAQAEATTRGQADDAKPTPRTRRTR